MNSTRPLNILINGWYGQRNAGDDAILDVFAEQTAQRFDAQIDVLSELPHNIAPTARMRGLPHPVFYGRNALRQLLNGDSFRHIKEVRKADLVVVGGGGLLRDNTNWRNLLRLLDEIWLARLFGRKTMLYAIGIGPFRTALGKWLIAQTVRRCDLVTVRSERCAALLREIGVAPERIHVVADPAFLFTPQVPTEPGIRALFGSGKKKVGFYPAWSLQNFPGAIEQVAAALDRLVELEGVEIVSVPMAVLARGKDDVEIGRRVRAAMRHPEALHLYEERLSAAELKWVTGQAVLNICVRLHAMIFSLGCHVPVVPINYEPKVRAVFDDFDAPEYLVDIDATLSERLVESSQRCLRNLDAYAAHIRERHACVVPLSTRTFNLMQELFPSTQPQRLATGKGENAV